MGRAERTIAEIKHLDRIARLRASRSTMSLAKIQGWPEAMRSAAFRLTLTERIKRRPAGHERD